MTLSPAFNAVIVVAAVLSALPVAVQIFRGR